MSIKEIATAEIKKQLVKLMFDVSNGRYTVQVMDISGPMSTWSVKDTYENSSKEEARSIFLCQVKNQLEDPEPAELPPKEIVREKLTGDPELETKLRSWRRKMAEERGWPPYRVMTEQSLRCLVENPVQNIESLGKVPGFGPKKLAQFGTELLAVLDSND